MARGRKPKKKVVHISSSPECNLNGADSDKTKIENNEKVTKDKEFKNHDEGSIMEEVERHCAPIRATRDKEIEHLKNELHLLRSHFDKEQLQTPLIQFFVEKFPNLAILTDGNKGQFEVHWNESIKNGDQRMNASLFRGLCTSNPNCPSTISAAGIELSRIAEETGLQPLDDPRRKDFAPSDTFMFGLPDTLQTPGMIGGKLSIGTTPKTLRVPRHGESILSLRGSPLGIYKNDNMISINECEEG